MVAAATDNHSRHHKQVGPPFGVVYPYLEIVLSASSLVKRCKSNTRITCWSSSFRESFNLNKELKNHALRIRREGNGMKRLWSDPESDTNGASCTVSNKRGRRNIVRSEPLPYVVTACCAVDHDCSCIISCTVYVDRHSSRPGGSSVPTSSHRMRQCN